MNTPNIDILMKAAAPTAKAPPVNSPREDGDSFGNYLRDAAEANSASTEMPSAKPPVAKEKPTEEQLLATTAGQEQGSTATPDQKTIPTEPLETTAEEEASEAISDEVILSVAAGALVEGEVQVVPTEVVVEVPTEVVAEIPSEGATQCPASEQSEAETLPLDIVDATENTTTCSEDENRNDEKLVSIEPILADEKSVEVAKNEVAKNSALTPVVEAPKAAVAPKPTKPIIPDKATETDSGKKEVADETVNFDAAIVEAVAKIIEAAPVTTETPTIESKAETPTPAAPSPVGVTQNQSQPIQSQPAHAEAPAPHAEGESPMPTIDRARFVQRVANAFRSAQQNDGQIQMRLSPPELGSLKIEIAVRNGVLSANLEAETPDARRVLLDNLPALRQRLAEQDIRIEKFEVDIRQEGGQQRGQAEAQQQQAEQQSQNAAARNRIRTSSASEVMTARVSRGVTTTSNSGLDVRV